MTADEELLKKKKKNKKKPRSGWSTMSYWVSRPPVAAHPSGVSFSSPSSSCVCVCVVLVSRADRKEEGREPETKTRE